jgi:hypothetical protein
MSYPTPHLHYRSKSCPIGTQNYLSNFHPQPEAMTCCCVYNTFLWHLLQPSSAIYSSEEIFRVHRTIYLLKENRVLYRSSRLSELSRSCVSRGESEGYIRTSESLPVVDLITTIQSVAAKYSAEGVDHDQRFNYTNFWVHTEVWIFKYTICTAM